MAEDKLETARKAGAHEVLMQPSENEAPYQSVGRVLSI